MNIISDIMNPTNLLELDENDMTHLLRVEPVVFHRSLQPNPLEIFCSEIVVDLCEVGSFSELVLVLGKKYRIARAVVRKFDHDPWFHELEDECDATTCKDCNVKECRNYRGE